MADIFKRVMGTGTFRRNIKVARDIISINNIGSVSAAEVNHRSGNIGRGGPGMQPPFHPKAPAIRVIIIGKLGEAVIGAVDNGIDTATNLKFVALLENEIAIGCVDEHLFACTPHACRAKLSAPAQQIGRTPLQPEPATNKNTDHVKSLRPLRPDEGAPIQ